MDKHRERSNGVPNAITVRRKFHHDELHSGFFVSAWIRNSFRNVPWVIAAELLCVNYPPGRWFRWFLMAAVESIIQVVRFCLQGAYPRSLLLGLPSWTSAVGCPFPLVPLGVLLVSLFGNAMLASSNVKYEVDLWTLAFWIVSHLAQHLVLRRAVQAPFSNIKLLAAVHCSFNELFFGNRVRSGESLRLVQPKYYYTGGGSIGVPAWWIILQGWYSLLFKGFVIRPWWWFCHKTVVKSNVFRQHNFVMNISCYLPTATYFFLDLSYFWLDLKVEGDCHD